MKTSCISWVNVIMITLSCLQSVNSQDYISFNFSDGVWIEEENQKENSSIRQLYCIGDTIIGDDSYNKLYEFSIYFFAPGYYPDTSFTHYIGAIRNNDSKQVLFVNKGSQSETLIYDFNLNLGDTIPFEIPVEYFIIREIDSIEICGSYHRRYINYLGNSSCTSSYLVEGIGYSNGLLGYFNTFGNCENYSTLTCYVEWNNQSCSDCDLLLSRNLKKITEDPVNIFPNPTNSYLRINSSKIISSLMVVDLSGVVLFSETNLNTLNHIIYVENSKPGPYIVQFRFIDHSTWSKIIFKN